MAISTITAGHKSAHMHAHAQRLAKGGGKGLTDPLQLLPVTVAQLVFEHGQQIRNYVQSLRQQAHALVHLEIAAHVLLDRLQLRLDPEKLRRVEHGAVKVNVNAEDEELANLHVDLRAAEVDFARERNLRRNVLARINGRRNKLFE